MGSRIWGADAALSALLDGGADGVEEEYGPSQLGGEPGGDRDEPIYFGIPNRPRGRTEYFFEEDGDDDDNPVFSHTVPQEQLAQGEWREDHGPSPSAISSYAPSFPQTGLDGPYATFSAVRASFHGEAGRRSSTNPDLVTPIQQQPYQLQLQQQQQQQQQREQGQQQQRVQQQQHDALASVTRVQPKPPVNEPSPIATQQKGASSISTSSNAGPSSTPAMATTAQTASLPTSSATKGRIVSRAAPVIVQSAAEMLRQRRTATAPPPVSSAAQEQQQQQQQQQQRRQEQERDRYSPTSPRSVGANLSTAGSSFALAQQQAQQQKQEQKRVGLIAADSNNMSPSDASDLVAVLLDLGFNANLCTAAAARFDNLADARRWCVDQTVPSSPSQASDTFEVGAHDAEFHDRATSVYFTFSRSDMDTHHSEGFAPGSLRSSTIASYPEDRSAFAVSAGYARDGNESSQRLRGATASMVPPINGYLSGYWNQNLVQSACANQEAVVFSDHNSAVASVSHGEVESVYQNIPWNADEVSTGGGYQIIPWELQEPRPPVDDSVENQDDQYGPVPRTRVRSLSSPNVFADETVHHEPFNYNPSLDGAPSSPAPGAGPPSSVAMGFASFAQQAAQARAAMLQRTANFPAAKNAVAVPKQQNPHAHRGKAGNPGPTRPVSFVPPKTAIVSPRFAALPKSGLAHHGVTHHSYGPKPGAPLPVGPAGFALNNRGPGAKSAGGSSTKMQHPHSSRRPSSFVPPPRMVPKTNLAHVSRVASPQHISVAAPTPKTSTGGFVTAKLPPSNQAGPNLLVAEEVSRSSMVPAPSRTGPEGSDFTLSNTSSQSAAAQGAVEPDASLKDPKVYALSPGLPRQDDDVAVYRKLKHELDVIPSSRSFHVKVIFPPTFPVVFKTIRLCLNWSMRDCVLFISHHMKFSAASRSGMGLKLSVFDVDAAHNTMRGDRGESDVNHISEDGILNPASIVNDVAHLIKANAGAIEYGYYVFGGKNPRDSEEALVVSNSKRLDSEPADSWREQPHAGMWSHPELGSELILVTDALVGKGHKPRWCTLQHNKLFMFTVAVDPLVIRRHLAANQKRLAREVAEQGAGGSAKPIPREMHELDPTDPRLTPIDSVYIYGARLWLGFGKPPPPGTPYGEIDPCASAASLPVISIGETAGVHTGRVTRITATDAQTLSVWFTALQQAQLREESRAHAVTHKFHVDERLAQRLGLQLNELLSPRDPTALFENATRIGKGGLASVFRARNKLSGEIVALKVMRMTSGNFRFLVRELLQHKALSNTTHDDNDAGILEGIAGSDLVVAFRDAYFVAAEGQLWIELEFMDIGALTSVLTPKFWRGAVLASPEPGVSAAVDEDPKPASMKVAKLMPEPVIAYIARRLLLAIHWLHRFRRLHRDLKSDNVLIKSDGSVKLADFGFVADIGEREVNPGARSTRNSVVGTPYWMAPEVINGCSYGSAVDIWSFGVTLIECAQCVPPLFRTPPGSATAIIAKKGILPLESHMLELALWSNDFVDFLEQSLAFNPAERADAVTLLAHPFLRKGEKIDRRTVFGHLPFSH